MADIKAPPGYVPIESGQAQSASTPTANQGQQQDAVQTTQGAQGNPTPQIQPPPGYVPVQPSAASTATTASTTPAINPVVNALNKVGEFGAGVVPGAVEAAGQTIQAIPYVGKKIISPEAMAAERAYFAPGSKAEAAGNVGGGVGEGVLEFVLGDEALKGLALADKIGIASKIEKIAKESPYIGALLRHGVTAARNGTVGTTEALAKGATFPEALKSGLETGAIGGTLGAAGELGQTAPSAVGRGVAIGTEVATGAGVTASGAAEALTPKKEGETDQQELERRIQGAVQGLMGARGLLDAAPHIKEAAKKIASSASENKTARVANEDLISARQDFKKAIPSTKSAPYGDNDLTIADAHLEQYHQNVGPIRSVQDTVDALDHSIKDVENNVSEHIKLIPNEPIATNVLEDVRDALSQNQRGQEFVDAGMKELDGLNLENITMERADAVRRQLNLENKAILKKNNYDLAAARAADPGFAAREAASESLRNGIYNQLENYGIEGARELRQEEGSLIKVRNAAQNQIFNAEKIVKGSSGASTARQIAAKTVKGASNLAGAGVGAAVAGPAGAVVGAATGGTLGDIASERIASPDLSRNELVERRFGKTIATTEPGQITVPKGIQSPSAPETKGQLTIPKETSTPAASTNAPQQADLFGQESPYPRYAGLQSPQAELALLQKTIRPLQAILNDPLASQADKVEAARKLASLPLADLQNPTVETGASSAEKKGAASVKLPYEEALAEIQDEPLEIPQNLHRGTTTADVLGHEWGHALVAHKEGFPIDGIYSHLHPELKGTKMAAAAALDLSSLAEGPDGLIPKDVYRKNLSRIMATIMGGAAADEVHRGIPFAENKNVAGDIRTANGIFKDLGLTPEEAEAALQAGLDRAKAHLTDEHAKAILTENRDVREPDLDKSLHASRKRLDEVFDELDRRQNEKGGNDKGLGQDSTQHGKDADARGKGGS